MTTFVPRMDGLPPSSASMVCDLFVADGCRYGNELPGVDTETIIGQWPNELETDAIVRLAHAVGELPTWDDYATLPPVAQKLAERARPQPLDLEIFRLAQHLQHVCYRPRLHLRVEEERLPVSRARRTPVRAVADLVSHPGDWEHRTLRSIQPSHVLARQIEDEWNLYENRVAVRLVDHLLAYLAKRLEELRQIENTLSTSRDHSDEARTSFWRARRLMKLWSDTLTTKTEDELRSTIRRLEMVQRDLQVLLDSPLYQRIPRRLSVGLVLKPTNILVNDLHYRKVAALWRAWVKFGRRSQETQKQRAERRHCEAVAWDRFVLHLVIYSFNSLGWSATSDGRTSWTLVRNGWSAIKMAVDKYGVIKLTSGKTLHLLPLCTDLSGADGRALTKHLVGWDALEGELVAVHVGAAITLTNPDQACAWSFGGRAVMFGCTPWAIDSEERMARLLNGWLNRVAVLPYPISATISELPVLPQQWTWLQYNKEYLVAFRPPDKSELNEARSWASLQTKQLEIQAQQAKSARQTFARAPRQAVIMFQKFLEDVGPSLVDLDLCPMCGDRGVVEPRPGKNPSGADATWWARCGGCSSEWGLRPCAECGQRYRALAPQIGIDITAISLPVNSTQWPDQIFGRDMWAQPCAGRAIKQFRCPNCAKCSGRGCGRCGSGN